MAFRSLFKASILAFLCGLLLGLGTFVYHSSVLIDYAQLRIPAGLSMNPFFIFLNNAFALSVVFFGAQFFSLVEIKSFEVYPPKLYLFLERLSSPLDRLFSFFDAGILGMKDPYKACYFILYSLPIMIIFLNVFFFMALFLHLVLMLGFSLSFALEVFLSFLWPLGLLEFSVLTVSAWVSLKHTNSIVPLLRKKRLGKVKQELRGYLWSSANWSLFLFFCLLLMLGAFYEVTMV